MELVAGTASRLFVGAAASLESRRVQVRVQPGIVAALSSGLAFGVCDFVAGIASRWVSSWWVTLISLATSVTGAWVVVAVTEGSPQPRALLGGALAGFGAAVGAGALYRGYGRGQMAVVGPLSAVGAAALPAVFGAFLGERLGAWGLVGVVIALPAIWLVSSSADSAGRQRGGGLVRPGAVDGLVSGAGFAVEFIGLERAGDSSGLWPVALSQSVALGLVALAVVMVFRPSVGAVTVGVRTPAVAALAGVLSLTATGLYFLASTSGLLTLAAVLASLYPVVTVVMAAVFIRERPGRRQVLGLVIAGAAVLLIVLG